MAKCLDVSDPKDIPGKYGNTRKVAEATVADETGAVVLSLWDSQIGSITKEDTIQIRNGYVSLVRGHMRLNVGKYGSLEKSDKALETSTAINMSDKEHEQEPRRFRSGGGGGGGGGRRYGGGGREHRDRDFGSGGDDRPKYMNKGRRRF